MSCVRHYFRTGKLHKIVIYSLAVIVLSGCAVVGPSSVRSGRLAYNAAIIETDNQQMLLLAVRNRYGERSNLLAVSSITANVSVKASASTQLGFSDADNYSGNLVPFGAGFIYEENPTISYIPVGGGQYVRYLMSPIPITFVAQITQNVANPGPLYAALLTSINDLYNPDFKHEANTTDVRFSRTIELFSQLTKAHRMHWVQQSDQENHFSLVFEHFRPDHAGKVGELFQLLGLAEPAKDASRVTVPVSVALQNLDPEGIAVTTRSIYDLLEILSSAVDIPAIDAESGVAVSYPPPGLIGSKLKVHYSEKKPDAASVAVTYRNGWYYIDETDHTTKVYFTLLASLLSMTIADTTDHNASPVLTVPVSR